LHERFQVSLIRRDVRQGNIRTHGDSQPFGEEKDYSTTAWIGSGFVLYEFGKEIRRPSAFHVVSLPRLPIATEWKKILAIPARGARS
jgi:hypothetical protein